MPPVPWYRTLLIAISIIFSLVLAGFAAGTIVSGRAKKCDQDGNGYYDEGAMVNGHYRLFALLTLIGVVF